MPSTPPIFDEMGWPDDIRPPYSLIDAWLKSVPAEQLRNPRERASEVGLERKHGDQVQVGVMALLLGFVAAPYTHVHQSARGVSDAHDHHSRPATLLHAHGTAHSADPDTHHAPAEGDQDVEQKIWSVAGFVFHEAPPQYSNWRATESLDDYLKRHGVVAITGVDQRAITRHIRSAGANS